MRKSTIIAALLLIAPSISQAKSLEELLVEKGVITRGEGRGSQGASASKVYWNGGTKVDFPDQGFTFGINTLLQTRYTFTDNDEGSSNTSSFEVHKAKIVASGTALHEEFAYEIEADFVGAEADSGSKSPELQDAYIQWNVCDNARTKLGQFKVPLSRQFNTSDQSLQFADRSVASNYFSLGRQQGLAGKYKLDDSDTVVLSAGIFNGHSTGEGINSVGVDTKHTGVASLRVNALGSQNAFEEGDISNTQETALNAGITYAYTEDNVAASVIKTDNISVDANLKTNGLSVHGEFFVSDSDVEGSSDSVEPVGFYTQVGYFIDPQLELAGRYGLLDCDDGKAGGAACSGNNKVNQVTAGLNYYFWKHNLKAQLNYDHINERVLADGANDIDTDRWLLQLSSYF